MQFTDVLERSAVRCAAALVALAVAGLAGADLAQAQALSPPRLISLYPGAAAPPPVTVAVVPSPASVQSGATVQFAATVIGTPNTSVVWSATGGSVSPTGLYTAGAAAGTFTVTATLKGGTLAGSAQVSVAPSTVSATIAVAPGESVQAAVNSVPEGAVILLKAGVHRLQTIAPKNRQTITGELGTVLSGARLLTSFSRSGSAWLVTGQAQEGSGAGECAAGFPRCARPEDLFIDDVPLRHVGSLADAGPGRWYFDYSTDTIFFWDDPTGRRVETSVTTYAFIGNASQVTIRNLRIEKYANPAQNGVIRGGAYWVVEGNDVRLNHGIGIHMGESRRVMRNVVHRNGQMGIGGTGNNALVEGNEIAYNNTAGFDPYWEAGGTKFTFSRNLMVRNNFVHHNNGPGLWTDIDNIDVTFEYNRVEDNAYTGIGHEIGYRAVIRYNTVSRNGTARPYPYWVEGAGITVSTSSDTEVYGNTVIDNWQGIMAVNANRGTGTYGVRVLSNLWVHDNTVVQNGTVQAGSARSGLTDLAGTSAFTGLNNRFTGNSYDLPASGLFFIWMNTELTDAQWRGYGQDLTGVIAR
jgi:hypothetical protein